MNKKRLKISDINNLNKLKKDRLYKSIIESVDSSLKNILEDDEEIDEDDCDIEECDSVEEGELNELFGFGSSVKKPEVALSVDNSDEKNAEIFIQWCEYYINKAGSNVANGVAELMKVCEKVLVKSPMIVVKGILMVLSGTIKFAVFEAKEVAAIIVYAYAALVKLVKSGVNNADEALTKFKDTLKSKATVGYKSFKSNTDAVIKETSDKFTMWLGIASALAMVVAEKLEGAADAFGEFVKCIAEDVKKKVEAAALIVKTWLSSKSKAVKSYLLALGEDVKTNAVKAWNGLDKATRKAYNKVAETLEKWMGSLKDLVTELGKKIDTAKENVKSFVIDKKDKALVWNIQKAVKGLSDKYKEDEVVALVRKAYNESIKPNMNGNFVINEAYFYERGSKKRTLYENHRKAIKRNKILS